MQNSTPSSDHRLITIILSSASVFVLCTVILGIWAFQKIKALEVENSSLNETRLILISKLKENNSEILSLKKLLQPNRDSVVKIEKPKPVENYHFQGSEEIVKKVNGIPVSISNGPVDQQLVCLTFDGGSQANAVNEILDTLRSRNIKATMFVTGKFIQKFPDAIRKILAENHELGNHTYSHPHLTTYEQNRKQVTLPEISPKLLSEELFKADKVLFELSNHHFAPLWRAPYGELNPLICSWALNAGYMHVSWRQGKVWSQNLDSNDWIFEEGSPGYKSPHDVLMKILAVADTKPYGINGGIILMHLGTMRTQKEKQVHNILGAIIDSLTSRGYTFVKASEMVNNSGISLPAAPEVKMVSINPVHGN